MFFATDLDTVTHGIQLAVAPVFLLTAVAGMIGTVAGRLARIIDRARKLEEQIDAAAADNPMTHAFAELGRLRQRGKLVNACIALLTFCAILIGLTIVALFLGETTELQIFRMATILFLSGVGCFLLALIGFLAETLIATRVLKFDRSLPADFCHAPDEVDFLQPHGRHTGSRANDQDRTTSDRVTPGG